MTPGELSRIEDTLRRAYGDVLESVRRDGSSPELMPGFQPGRPGRRFGRPGRAGSSRRLAPVAAAAAVAVIALVAGLIVPGALRPAAAPAVHLGYVDTTRAPQYFNPLRPYARFGWLPPKSPSFPGDGEVISQRMMSLGNPSRRLPRALRGRRLPRHRPHAELLAVGEPVPARPQHCPGRRAPRLLDGSSEGAGPTSWHLPRSFLPGSTPSAAGQFSTTQLLAMRPRYMTRSRSPITSGSATEANPPSGSRSSSRTCLRTGRSTVSRQAWSVTSCTRLQTW